MGEQLPALIRAMSTPEFYGYEVTKNVTLIQTHISYLLLGDQFTYKIKKDLNLGFLDFRLLKDRKHFCEEEIRLNSKLASKLYIEAIPIYQTPDGHYSLSFQEDGKVIEYAVKMHTFDNKNLFSALFDNSQLDQNTFRALAHHLAEHHLYSAQTNNTITSYGRPENIQRILDGNFSIVENYVDKTISSHLFNQLKKNSYIFLEHHRAQYEQRVKVGKIRENHGDIHLNNICLYNNEVQIFDCIEFNEQFKNIDCIYDVAFLFMDLIYRENMVFAYTFLNEYLEHTGDYDAVRLLPLYSSMRAFIRGKVISIETGDEHISEEQRKVSAQKASQYFGLSDHFLQPKNGKIIIVSGISGTGKSTLSKALYPRIGAIHLRSDAVRKHLTQTPLYEKSDNIYNEVISKATYERLAHLSVSIAQAGFDVIVDATFLRKDQRKHFLDEVNKHELSHYWLWCVAGVSELEKRIKKRQNDISDANTEVMKAQLELTEHPKEIDFIEVDTENYNPLEQLAPILGFK